MRFILTIVLFVFLNACSVVSYQLRDERPKLAGLSSCQISFALKLNTRHFSISQNHSPHEIVTHNKLIRSYIDSTKKKLTSLGCRVSQVTGLEDANFIIDIERNLYVSALPQEWLTGLSFGLIPSWGVKYGQYVFSFTHIDSNTQYSYQVDQYNYNHLLLFPFFWVTLITADEQRIYQKALTNFFYSL